MNEFGGTASTRFCDKVLLLTQHVYNSVKTESEQPNREEETAHESDFTENYTKVSDLACHFAGDRRLLDL